MTDPTTLLIRLQALAELAVDEALRDDYGDPEDRHIYRELQELKPLVQQVLAQSKPVGRRPSDDDIYGLFDWLKDEWHSNNEGEFPLPEFARAVLASWGNTTTDTP